MPMTVLARLRSLLSFCLHTTQWYGNPATCTLKLFR